MDILFIYQCYRGLPWVVFHSNHLGRKKNSQAYFLNNGTQIYSRDFHQRFVPEGHDFPSPCVTDNTQYDAPERETNADLLENINSTS